MTRLIAVLTLSLLTATVTAAQSPPPADTSSWKPFRDPTLGFEVKHPPTWGVRRTQGTLESVLLGEPLKVGKESLSMQFIVQRDINPTGLSIDRWYADQLRRLKVESPLPSTSTVLGGRPAIRREMIGRFGKSFDFYTTLHRSDIFQVSIGQSAPEQPLDQTYVAVLSTIKFVE